LGYNFGITGLCDLALKIEIQDHSVEEFMNSNHPLLSIFINFLVIILAKIILFDPAKFLNSIFLSFEDKRGKLMQNINTMKLLYNFFVGIFAVLMIGKAYQFSFNASAKSKFRATEHVFEFVDLKIGCVIRYNHKTGKVSGIIKAKKIKKVSTNVLFLSPAKAI
jgi:hypothetical protein